MNQFSGYFSNIEPRFSRIRYGYFVSNNIQKKVSSAQSFEPSKHLPFCKCLKHTSARTIPARRFWMKEGKKKHGGIILGILPHLCMTLRGEGPARRRAVRVRRASRWCPSRSLSSCGPPPPPPRPQSAARPGPWLVRVLNSPETWRSFFFSVPIHSFSNRRAEIRVSFPVCGFKLNLFIGNNVKCG